MADIFGKYTEQARETLVAARAATVASGSPRIESEHLLLGLLKIAPELVNSCIRPNGGVQSMREEIIQRSLLGGMPHPEDAEIPLGHTALAILSYIDKETQSAPHVGPEHLLMGILWARLLGAQILTEHGAELEDVRAAIKHPGRPFRRRPGSHEENTP